MKKILILILVLVVLGVGFYVYNKNEAKAPTQTASQNENAGEQTPQQNNQTAQNPISTTTAQTTPTSTQANAAPAKQFSTGDETVDSGNNVQVVEVDFDGTKFTPSTVTIHQNDWVFFKNKSSEDFWPASNPHPTHTDYPGFDAKQSIAPGGEYKFQFTKVGSWGYHDHLDHTIGGTVVVTQ